MIRLAIIKQEYPENKYRAYRLIEHMQTTDGIRSRICEGTWETYEEALEEYHNRGGESV